MSSFPLEVVISEEKKLGERQNRMKKKRIVEESQGRKVKKGIGGEIGTSVIVYETDSRLENKTVCHTENYIESFPSAMWGKKKWRARKV